MPDLQKFIEALKDYLTVEFQATIIEADAGYTFKVNIAGKEAAMRVSHAEYKFYKGNDMEKLMAEAISYKVNHAHLL